MPFGNIANIESNKISKRKMARSHVKRVFADIPSIHAAILCGIELI